MLDESGPGSSGRDADRAGRADLVHGDQPALADERVDLVGAQLGRLDVELDGVADEKEVVVVVDVLVALVPLEGVLDGEVVEAQLRGQHLHVPRRRVVEIHPHRGPAESSRSDTSSSDAPSRDLSPSPYARTVTVPIG